MRDRIDTATLNAARALCPFSSEVGSVKVEGNQRGELHVHLTTRQGVESYALDEVRLTQWERRCVRRAVGEA